jgi:hypothetical protein
MYAENEHTANIISVQPFDPQWMTITMDILNSPGTITFMYAVSKNEDWVEINGGTPMESDRKVFQNAFLMGNLSGKGA